MAQYRHSAHATYDLKHHVIWITKYRYKALRGRVAERARDLIRQICQARNVVIIRGAVSPDHIDMLPPPHLAPIKLVQYIKGRFSPVAGGIPGASETLLGQHLWARGYFCATVSVVDEATIKAYTENLKWDEDDQGFKIPRPPRLKPALSRDSSGGFSRNASAVRWATA
jgi:putative transposase